MSQCQRLVNQRHILKINSCFWILTVFIIHTALWKHQLGSLSTSDEEGLPAVMRLMKWRLPRGEDLPTEQKSQQEGALWPLLLWLLPTLSNYLLLIISKYSLPSLEYYKVNEAKIKLLSWESRQLFKIIRYALNIPIVNNLSLLLFLLWRYNFFKTTNFGNYQANFSEIWPKSTCLGFHPTSTSQSYTNPSSQFSGYLMFQQLMPPITVITGFMVMPTQRKERHMSLKLISLRKHIWISQSHLSWALRMLLMWRKWKGPSCCTHLLLHTLQPFFSFLWGT